MKEINKVYETTIALILINRDDVIVEKTKLVTGYTSTRIRSAGRPLMDILHEELMDVTNKIIKDMRTNGYRCIKDVVKQTSILRAINNN